MLAASRKDKVNGRTKILVVSMRIRNGFSQSGAPSGNRWAVDALGAFAKVDNKKDIHNGRPNDIVKIKWLDKLKVYGTSPSKLIRIIIENRGVIIEPVPFKCCV